MLLVSYMLPIISRLRVSYMLPVTLMAARGGNREQIFGKLDFRLHILFMDDRFYMGRAFPVELGGPNRASAIWRSCISLTPANYARPAPGKERMSRIFLGRMRYGE